MNGWKNHSTWNVSLWIQNEEPLYELAKRCQCYEELVIALGEMEIYETPDGVSYKADDLDTHALNEMMGNL